MQARTGMCRLQVGALLCSPTDPQALLEALILDEGGCYAHDRKRAHAHGAARHAQRMALLGPTYICAEQATDCKVQISRRRRGTHACMAVKGNMKSFVT